MTPVEPQTQAATALALPAAEIRIREILGAPIAITDCDGAMDAMDVIVASREKGYVCAVLEARGRGLLPRA
jgi:hypothetical protein